MKQMVPVNHIERSPNPQTSAETKVWNHLSRICVSGVETSLDFAMIYGLSCFSKLLQLEGFGR